MASYSPFSKSLEDITGDDLQVLRAVDEGWFVDYKSQAVKPVDFGKHLSAFANQFGGWLFIGIKEGQHKSMKADSFPGIDTSDVPKTLIQIREGIAAHVSTPILFSHRVIDGPVESLGLDSNKSIIIVHVPEGDNPPYIHSTGRIYRRIADSSEPEAETNRSVLDGMWRKAENHKARLSEFILDPVSRNQSDPRCGAYAYVYLLHDLSLGSANCGLSFQQFKAALDDGRANGKFPILLDNVFPTQDGYIARHYMGRNGPNDQLLSLRWWLNGNVRFTIPIEQVSSSDCWSPRSCPHLKILCEAMGVLPGKPLPQNGYNLDSVLDLGMLCFCIAALEQSYFALRDKCGLAGSVRTKAVLTGVRNAIPFIPMQCLIDQVLTGGVPISQDSVVVVPKGTLPDTFLEVADIPSSVGSRRADLVSAQLAIPMLRAMGVGIERIDPGTEQAGPIVRDYLSGVILSAETHMKWQQQSKG